MTQRIDGSTSNYVPTTTQEKVQPEEAKGSQIPTCPPLNQEAIQSQDQWEPSSQNPLDAFVNPGAGANSGGGIGSKIADAFLDRALEPARSVWEMVNAESAPASVAPGSTEGSAPTSDSPGIAAASVEAAPTANESRPVESSPFESPGSISDNQIVRGMAQALAELPANAGPREMRREAALIFDGARNPEIIELAKDMDGLRAHLEEIAPSERVLEGLLGELESRVVSIAGERITEIVSPQLRGAIEQLDSLDASSESRRAFLGMVATVAPSEAALIEALQTYGVGTRAAQNLAAGLQELRGDPEKMAAFLSGARGERSVGNPRGEFASLERTFSGELSRIRSGLDSLDRGLRSEQIRQDRFLTNEVVAPFREAVFSEMGVERGANGNGLGEIFDRATRDSSRAQTRENVGKGVIAVAGGIALALATGGAGTLPAKSAVGAAAKSTTGGAGKLAAGLITAGASNSLDVLIAQDDIYRAQGQVFAELGGAELIAQAEGDRNVEVALAVAKTLMAQVPRDYLAEKVSYAVAEEALMRSSVIR